MCMYYVGTERQRQSNTLWRMWCGDTPTCGVCVCVRVDVQMWTWVCNMQLYMCVRCAATRQTLARCACAITSKPGDGGGSGCAQWQGDGGGGGGNAAAAAATAAAAAAAGGGGGGDTNVVAAAAAAAENYYPT